MGIREYFEKEEQDFKMQDFKMGEKRKVNQNFIWIKKSLRVIGNCLVLNCLAVQP